jgi:O-antigen biosynthesis protein
MKTSFQINDFPWATFGRLEKGRRFSKKLEEQRSRVLLFKKPPLVSLVIPVSTLSQQAALERCLAALALQSYPHWEALLVAPENLNLPPLPPANIRRVRWEGTWNEAKAKNAAVAQSQGKWIGVLEPTDVLSPAALYLLQTELERFPDTDVIYCNEIRWDPKNFKIETFFSKPEFSWFDLIHYNYIGRFWMVTRALWETNGGMEEKAREAHEHDFLLRLTENKARFRGCPLFLYYAAKSDRPADSPTLAKVISAHLQRKGFRAEVEARTEQLPSVKVTPKTKPKSHLISVIICFRNQAEMTLQALADFARQVGETSVEVFLVNNQSEPSERERVQRALTAYSFPVTLVDYDRPYNFAHMHNDTVRKHCRGDLLLLLNNDVFLQSNRTLDRMASWAEQDWVGTVGCLLKYPDGGVQHSGLKTIFGGEARLVRIGNAQEDDCFTHQAKELFGVTFAACLLKKSTFESVGGLRELDYPNGFGDVAFNFQCLRRGLKNIYLGDIEGIHKESASRGMEYEYWEECSIEREYPEILQRMLRTDLGINRVPGADFPVYTLLRQAARKGAHLLFGRKGSG